MSLELAAVQRHRWTTVLTHRTEAQAFFAARAGAVTAAAIPTGGTAIDVGCGTGRARPRAHASRAGLLLADALHLPLPDRAVDTVFAAGLVTHLPDTDAGLRELARITRPSGRLVLFHPSGRAALAARHGRDLRPDEPLAETPLRAAARRTGWELTSYDDPPHRFLATATRR
jgi:SAM-dependent methyltransferase